MMGMNRNDVKGGGGNLPTNYGLSVALPQIIDLEADRIATLRIPRPTEERRRHDRRVGRPWFRPVPIRHHRHSEGCGLDKASRPRR